MRHLTEISQARAIIKKDEFTLAEGVHLIACFLLVYKGWTMPPQYKYAKIGSIEKFEWMLTIASTYFTQWMFHHLDEQPKYESGGVHFNEAFDYDGWWNHASSQGSAQRAGKTKKMYEEKMRDMFKDHKIKMDKETQKAFDDFAETLKNFKWKL